MTSLAADAKQKLDAIRRRPNGKQLPPPKLDWRDFLVVDEPPAEIPLISITGAPVATAGNHSLVVGKKKSRKSLFLSWLLSQYKGDISGEAMHFDTEQGKHHVWKGKDRTQRLTGYHVRTFCLRGKSPAERKQIIEDAIVQSEPKPKMIIIDGIRDLTSNINDPDQTSELITWVEKLTLDHGVHIINVLHLNKTDNNPRGHLGTELQNKAEVTIELELDEQAGCTVVKCESSRDVPFETFAFTHNADGLPEIVTTPIKGKVISDTERRTRLRAVFEGEALKYSDALDGIKVHFQVGLNKAGHLLADFQRAGWVVKNGKDRAPDTVYKLMID
jgi:hypothetical protein